MPEPGISSAVELAGSRLFMTGTDVSQLFQPPDLRYQKQVQQRRSKDLCGVLPA